MAKKKSTAVLEGEEIAPTSDEETVVTQPAEEEATPDETPEEETIEEVPTEEIGPAELTNIKLLMKGPIRGADGHPIAEGQTGEVATSIADALVGRGQAEII